MFRLCGAEEGGLVHLWSAVPGPVAEAALERRSTGISGFGKHLQWVGAGPLYTDRLKQPSPPMIGKPAHWRIDKTQLSRLLNTWQKKYSSSAKGSKEKYALKMKTSLDDRYVEACTK